MKEGSSDLPNDRPGLSVSYYKFLAILDMLISALIVSPAVVGYWRSAWTLMDIHVLPSDPLMSAIVSTVIGVCGHMFFFISGKLFTQYFHPNKNRVLYYVVSRSYTMCYAFVCVNGWRGPWNLLDFHSRNSIFISTVVGVIALIVIRGLRNVSASPCAIVTDGVKGYFEVATMFRISAAEKTSLYILDCLFSVLIIGTLVVFVWRGAWILLDIYIFPENETLSSWASLVIGHAAVAMAFLLQPVMRYMCEHLSGTARLLVADLFTLFSFFGTVNVWRGIWNLLNLYFLPENMEMSCWIVLWVSLLLLILMGCSNSLLVRGVSIDAEEPDGKCVVFPCYYLRTIFQEDKLKQLQLSGLPVDEIVQNKSEKPLRNNYIPTISLTIN